MRVLKALLFALPISAIALTQSHDASACGGCLVQQSESTQVTGHKMILSVSKTQTTLWDQITYSGNPSSFAWVLPIKGTVDIGLSSDALFEALETTTAVNVNSPTIQCSPPPFCGDDNGGFGTGAASASAAGSTGSGGVSVVAQEVVGPYETVQLMSSDPMALKNWLAGHNYNLPADIAPVIDAYVNEGFNFLALKLVPGQGVSAMKPVRVTTPGASPALPLRMVAAGTGAVTSITLWVLGEGRYETASLPTFTIDQSQIVWNWDTQSSNYAALRKSGFDASQGKAWLVEDAEPLYKYVISDPLTSVAQFDPTASGYADDMGQGAPQAAADDMAALFDNIPDNALWVTRLHGELTRPALAGDLTLGASSDQSQVNRFLQATKTTGTPPACPTFPPCSEGTSTGVGGGTWDFWDNDKAHAGGGCNVSEEGDHSALLSGLVVAAALSISRLRRRSRR